MRTRALLVLVAAGAIGLAACGSDNSSSTSATAAPAAATATTAAPAGAATTATTADADSSSYGAGYGTPDTTAAPASAAAAATTTVTLATSPLGMILADAKGDTLYVFTKDTPGTSNCADACAKAWPAATVTGTPTAASGVSASALSTITRADGTTQLTINGQPLYTFAADTGPGATNGQGSNGIWWVVGADGTAIKS